MSRSSGAIGTVWVSKVGVELIDTFLDFPVLLLIKDRALDPLIRPIILIWIQTHFSTSGMAGLMYHSSVDQLQLQVVCTR